MILIDNGITEKIMSIELNAELRTDTGKGASRRLRHANKVPAILYGAGKDPENLTLEQKDVQYELQHEAFFTQVLELNVGGKKQDVLLRDLQHHPYKLDILHMDFQRVEAKKEMHVNVPLHFINEEIAPGVKTEGGAISHVITEVEVVCLPKNIPEFIDVDLSELHMGEIVHLSDLKMPAGVEVFALKQGEEHDSAVATIHARKVAEEPEVGEAAGEAAAEPEIKEEGGESEG
jgi:large subunit ribosomal protein L25